MKQSDAFKLKGHTKH